MSLSRTIMRLATRNPPAGREDWALAMQREFETLDEGRLSWALGCLTTTTGWKLRREWLYIAALLLAPLPAELAGPAAQIALMPGATHDTIMIWLPYTVLGPPMLVSFLLAAYRPHLKAVTWIGVAAVPLALTDLAAWIMDGTSPAVWWGPKSTLFMAPPLVGLCALLGVCYFGAAMGARFAQRRMA